MMTPTIDLATPIRNTFKSFDEFKAFVSQAFIEGSGIDPEIFDACIEFHEDVECNDGHDVSTPIHDALGWEFKRFGHRATEKLYAAFLKNEDGSVWQAIVSLWDEEQQRPYRYFAPKGNGDRAFLPPVPPTIRKRIGDRYGIEVPMEGSFWKWLEEIDIARILTEGGKKSLCLLSLGYVALTLYGCTCGAKNKDELDRYVKPYLTCDMERFAVEDSQWLFAFDRDEKQKAKLAVASGKKKLRLALNTAGCSTADIMWKVEDGKGVDDLVVNNGSGSFDAAYQKAIARLEKQFNTSSEKKWTQSTLAEELASMFKPELAWHIGNKCWYWYEHDHPGMWSDVAEETIGKLVFRETKNRIGTTFNYNYIAGTIRLLKHELSVSNWEQNKKLIPLIDGVLDPTTMQLLPHSPDYRFLWQLPYKWLDREIGCQPVISWFDEIMQHNSELVQMLRGYLKAVVTGRSDLHRFLEGIGPGGTGKSTFQRLAIALVGEENIIVTTLKQLEGNRFETAALKEKRLVVITDSERYGGEVSTLKAITGGDLVRNERKNIQQSSGFRFSGTVMVMANEPIQSSDYTSGLKRRRVPVPFQHQVPIHLQRNLESEFEPYLPGVLQWVLSMPDAEMERLIKNTEISVKSLTAFNAEFLIDTNPLADWLDNCTVVFPEGKTYVGTLDLSVELYLYPNYCKWIHSTGSKAVSLRRFSQNLIDLCCNQLKLPGITKGRDNRGAYITGIILRGQGMESLPRPITYSDESNPGSPGLSGENVIASTPASDGINESDGKDLKNQEEHYESYSTKKVEGSKPDNLLRTLQLLLLRISTITSPPAVIPEPTTPTVTKNESTPPNAKHDFAVGDQVMVDEVQAIDYPRLDRVKGKRVVVSTIDANGIWVRLPKATSPYGPFSPSQLKFC